MSASHNQTLAFFIPHLGCPHRCSFCDQRTISGTQEAPTPEQVFQTCKATLEENPTLASGQIGFFGGSFTAVEERYQIALLEAVQPFLEQGMFQGGIRVSTRPDAIDDIVLRRLRQYHVTAVELGAQSMEDKVLTANRRGHTAEEVRLAAEKIHSAGLSLGLQQMVGLYQSTLSAEYFTLEQLLQCKPDTLRIYPTVVLEGTELAQYWQQDRDGFLSFEEVLDFCAYAVCACHKEGVALIRMGLHDSASLRQHRIGGYYHPAFGELVTARLYRHVLDRAIWQHPADTLVVQVNPCKVSQLVGQKGCNRVYFAEKGIKLCPVQEKTVPKEELCINGICYNIFEIFEEYLKATPHKDCCADTQ